MGRKPARLSALLTVDKNAELPKSRNLLTDITLVKSFNDVAMLLPIFNRENEFQTNPIPLLKLRFIIGDFSLHIALALDITKKNEANSMNSQAYVEVAICLNNIFAKDTVGQSSFRSSLSISMSYVGTYVF